MSTLLSTDIALLSRYAPNTTPSYQLLSFPHPHNHHQREPLPPPLSPSQPVTPPLCFQPHICSGRTRTDAQFRQPPRVNHMILQLVLWIGVVAGFLLLVIAIALGLYYVLELVEEHTEPTKRILKRLILAIMGLYVLLMTIDRFPVGLLLFSIVSYYVYLQNLNRFPYVELTLPIFLGLCVLVVANHFLWFNHFHNPTIPSLEERLKPGYVPPQIPSFVEVCLFFGLLVWLVPFALFVSLSAHENLIPHHLDNPLGKKRNQGLAKVVVERARQAFYLAARAVGWELDSLYGVLA